MKLFLVISFFYCTFASAFVKKANFRCLTHLRGKKSPWGLQREGEMGEWLKPTVC